MEDKIEFKKEGNRLLKLTSIHHIAIICSDYQRSKDFYTRILGLKPIREVYREERKSFKLDLALNGEYIIELFSFDSPPKRMSYPEAAGLRHLAFGTGQLEDNIHYLKTEGIEVEPIRIDPYTEKRCTFFSDPDGLPIELYEK